MNEFCPDRRIYISHADSLLPAKVGFEHSQLLPRQRPYRLIHPVGEVKFVQGSIQIISLAGPLFDCLDGSVGVEYPLDDWDFGVSLVLKESALHFDFDEDVSFDGYLSSLKA